MKMKRNYEVKRSMAFDINLSIPDKTFNQRDITIDLGLPQIQLTNDIRLISGIYELDHMPLINDKSTIFKPHGPPHIRDDICVYLVEIVVMSMNRL